ncbi:hypothetical protein PMAYCL1PPCAC_21810, partial [Pristionchus mayeri]
KREEEKTLLLLSRQWNGWLNPDVLDLHFLSPYQSADMMNERIEKIKGASKSPGETEGIIQKRRMD